MRRVGTGLVCVAGGLFGLWNASQSPLIKESKWGTPKDLLAQEPLPPLPPLSSHSSSDDKKTGKVSANMVSSLKAKSYLANNSVAQSLKEVQVLVVGEALHFLKDQLDCECHDSLKFFDIDAAARRLVVCGQTSFLEVDAQPAGWTAESVEEMGIRVRGETGWGLPMRPSGVFSSYILSRRFGRDSVSTESRPHAVLAFSDSPNMHLEELRQMCREQGVPLYVFGPSDLSLPPSLLLSRVFSDLKTRFKCTLVDNYAAARYREGHKEGKREGQEKNRRAKAAAVEEVTRRFEANEAFLKETFYIRGYRDRAEGRPPLYSTASPPVAVPVAGAGPVPGPYPVAGPGPAPPSSLSSSPSSSVFPPPPPPPSYYS